GLQYPVAPEPIENAAIVSNLFAGFMWGQPLLVLPSAVIFGKLGLEVTYSFINLIRCLTILVQPSALQYNPWLVFIIRVFQGTLSGVLYMITSPIWFRNGFPALLGVCVATSMGINRVGSIMPNIIGGYYCKFGDWTTQFYLCGGCAFLVNLL